MSTWLYQMSQDDPEEWSANAQRAYVWEGKLCTYWQKNGSADFGGAEPEPGDRIVLLFAPGKTRSPLDTGFCGWGVITKWWPRTPLKISFRVAPPSDRLKMRPWWDDDAKRLVDGIRGAMKQRTLWRVQDDAVAVNLLNLLATWPR
jgi:hypothetical protein